ncbi:response regulator [Cohnella endophytica]|uniref:histidine kinase n=2 Tax=Cohnella endophytica TaxID=2419778 RepID=A0A494XEL0_9BACL|nr:response regulator [Cohnella endophytica]
MRNAFGIVGFSALALALFIGIFHLSRPPADSPKAKSGVLDLSGWNFKEQGLAHLNGEWEFYGGKLLEPGDSINPDMPAPVYSNVPGTWKGNNENAGIPRKGFGTYHLKVLLPEAEGMYGLKIHSIRMSHRLYVNGALIGSSGNPAAEPSAHEPGNTPYSAFFQTDGKAIDVVLQIANFEFVTGGVVSAIQFGLPEDIAFKSGIQLGTDIASVFVLGMFGAYQLSFNFIRKREKTYLFGGLYLFALVLVQLFYGEKIALRVWPGIPFEMAYKLLELAQISSMALIFLFYASIDTRILKGKTLAVLLAPYFLYMAGLSVVPYSALVEVKGYLFVYASVLMLFILFRLLMLFISELKKPNGRRELALFIGGSLSLLVFLVDGTLYSESIVSDDLISKGALVCFIVLTNIMLALRFGRALKETEQLARQLAASNRRKDEFLTMTSHELQTPLHGILNLSADVLADGEAPPSDRHRKQLGLIRDTSIKLSMIVRDLVDVTRLKHDELRLETTAVDVRVTTQIVCDVLRFELGGKNITLDNRVDEGVGVEADENRLLQVLYNLVQNAIKHTERGTIRIYSISEGEFERIVVEDTGVGIPQADREKVFGYFEQLELPSGRGRHAGMGVGLYISRMLAERMSGSLAVEWSELGRGTRMALVLPSSELPSSERESAASLEVPAAQNREDAFSDVLGRPGATVLIVDDEASNIHALLSILKRHDYNVVTAFSSREAAEKLVRHPEIDLVVLDVMMPAESGIELCRSIRRRRSILDLPILFATVKDSPYDIALGFGAGANDYVTKPFEGETLLARIHTLLAMKSALKEAIRNEQAFHQAQIKPHFLYNALSGVISFCYTDGERAAYLLTMLSQYLRHILDMDRDTSYVPLHQELELVEAYVEIEKARFEDSFEFRLEVDDAVIHERIPSLCIQPFVENAIRHGLFEKENGTVSLRIDEGDRYLKVTVEDDGIGIPDDLAYRLANGDGLEGSIGIANIRKRLAAVPGASLQIDSDVGRGTKVTMYLPIFGLNEERRNGKEELE